MRMRTLHWLTSNVYGVIFTVLKQLKTSCNTVHTEVINKTDNKIMRQSQ